ncbi:MAG: RtcB family protein, partial [Planctomycetota bacterium]
DWPSWFDCTHNFVRHETHDGPPLWVHRKGACSARHHERAIVPGSMGSRSFHVEGRGVDDAMSSCSHGAGRRLPRGEAMRTIRASDVERQLEGVFFDRANRAALRDEAPSAYKDIGAVMRAQRDLVRIVRTLRPVLAFKGA